MVNRIDCDWVAEHMPRVLDGVLSDDERCSVDRHLRSCPSCILLVRDAEKEEDLLREALLLSDVTPDSSAPPRPVIRSPLRLLRTPRSWAAGLAAACLVLFFALRERSVTRSADRFGTDTEKQTPSPEAQPAWRNVNSGAWFAKGDRFTASADVPSRLTLRDSTVLNVDRGGEVQLNPDGIVLEAGRVLVDVTPGGTGFAVTTRHGTVCVTGTRFAVEARARQTTVHVLEGQVIVSNAEGQTTVPPGSMTTLRSGTAPRAPLPADSLPRTEWAGVRGEELDLPVEAKLQVRYEPDGESRALLADISYGKTNCAELWLYTDIETDRGEHVASLREQVVFPDQRYRVRRVVLPNLEPGEYRAMARIGHGPKAARATALFRVD